MQTGVVSCVKFSLPYPTRLVLLVCSLIYQHVQPGVLSSTYSCSNHLLVFLQLSYHGFWYSWICFVIFIEVVQFFTVCVNNIRTVGNMQCVYTVTYGIPSSIICVRTGLEATNTQFSERSTLRECLRNQSKFCCLKVQWIEQAFFRFSLY